MLRVRRRAGRVPCRLQPPYNELRPHQNLGGMTQAEVWEGIDPFHAPAALKAVDFIEGWAGLLAAFRIRR